MKVTQENVINAIVREQISHRGGGVEIELSQFGFPDGSLMSAYQNYLGGGMLGAIQSNHNMFRMEFTKAQAKKIENLSEILKRYLHDQTNHEDDEWESATYLQNQMRPESAY
jgi:hypothetical protein